MIIQIHCGVADMPGRETRRYPIGFLCCKSTLNAIMKDSISEKGTLPEADMTPRVVTEISNREAQEYVVCLKERRNVRTVHAFFDLARP